MFDSFTLFVTVFVRNSIRVTIDFSAPVYSNRLIPDVPVVISPPVMAMTAISRKQDLA
jgi:hypothetical protein